MIPLVVLISVFTASLLIIYLVKRKIDYSFSGRIAMTCMLLVTTIGHFRFTEGMSMMLPDFIPFRTALIYITGVIELSAAVGLMIPRLQRLTGFLLILFFILTMPANIYAAINHLNLEKATYTGPGITYLWFRIPLQIFFIVWVYFFAVYRKNS